MDQICRLFGIGKMWATFQDKGNESTKSVGKLK